MTTVAIEQVNPDDDDDDDGDESEYVHGEWWGNRGPTASRPLVSTRCDYIKKNGKRCRNWSVNGLRMCTAHSGHRHLPNIQEYQKRQVENARLRLLGAAQDAAEAIIDLSSNAMNENVRLKASTEILDRVGIRGGTEIAVEGKIEVTESPADILRARLDTLASRVAPAPLEIEDAEIVTDGEPEQMSMFGED